ncbi:MAG TPA: tyrosinase family protein [Pyrinomonadaceae bacterium]|nr:tyrosinase family protein [Pyrinomonadaceae bacterium]
MTLTHQVKSLRLILISRWKFFTLLLTSIALLLSCTGGNRNVNQPGAEGGAPPNAPLGPVALKQRKNISEVEQSPDELKNLRHAFFMLMKKSPTCSLPTAQNDYDCWAAYHNNSVSYGCQHATDLFWPWHRYHLAEFEEALRNSDAVHPERVRNVTLPFWNWTAPASGTLFPKSLEQEKLVAGEYYPEDCPDPANCANPLYRPGRRKPVDVCSQVKTECIQEGLALTSWKDFGGPVDSKGAFETQVHDYMHGLYIRGLMGRTSTASQDPIYWLFHAFIDNVWDQWQKVHEPDPCNPAGVPDLTRELRKPGKGWPPAGVTFANVACTKKLNYEYVQGVAPALTLVNCPDPLMGCNQTVPLTPVALDISTPIAEVNQAKLALNGVTTPNGFTYLAEIYLHPTSVKFQPNNKDFDEKYGASYFVSWRHGEEPGEDHSAHPKTVDLQLDVTRRLNEILKRQAADRWVATIVFSPADKTEHPASLVFGRDVNLARVSLVVTEGGNSKEIPLVIRR